MESQGLGGFFGRTIPRNQGRDPWTSSLDLSLRQQIPIPGSSNLEITFDILNFMNLIDKNSGHNYYTSFGTVTPAELVGVDEATGKPIYHLEDEVLEPSDNPTRQLDNIRSRWRAKLGVRWSF
jgi:hypothetical protein